MHFHNVLHLQLPDLPSFLSYARSRHLFVRNPECHNIPIHFSDPFADSSIFLSYVLLSPQISSFTRFLPHDWIRGLFRIADINNSSLHLKRRPNLISYWFKQIMDKRTIRWNEKNPKWQYQECIHCNVILYNRTSKSQ